MSTLLHPLELEESYDIIRDGSFAERLAAFYDDVDLRELEALGDIRIEGPIIDELSKHLSAMVGKRTLVVSDYDADGIMALSIFLRLLDHLHIEYNYIIPSRTRDGYGLNDKIIDSVIDYRFDYLVTLDNGIVAKDAIARAKEAGVKVVVIDHHIFKELPVADVIVHPDLLDPYHRDMCTAGLVYGISQRYYDDPYSLVLAMIGTVADVVPVFRANRAIITKGLKTFISERDIAANIKVLYKGQVLDSEDVAFKISPKINAISRLDPLVNVNTFIPYFKDGKLDMDMATKIMKINDIRKDKTEVMLKRARDLITDTPFLIIDSPDFLEGLCGIVAGKIAEEAKKPCLVLAAGDIYKGSGRVSFDFDIYSYLYEHKDLFLAFGGHKRAVGLSIDKVGLDTLKEITKDLKYSYDKSRDTIIYIREEDLTVDNMALLSRYEPFGEGLKRPVFYLDSPAIRSSYLIKGLYPKFYLASGNELFSFSKEHYGQDLQGAIGTLSIDKSSKISMSIKQIVI